MSALSGSGKADGPGEKPPGLNWEALKPGGPGAEVGENGEKTSRSATFIYNHISYTVTVDYNRRAIMDCYGVDNEEVDALIEEIFSKMKLQHLSGLAGYSVCTSLSDIEKAQYQPLEGGKFKSVSELERAKPELFATIQKVVQIFASHKKIEEEDEKEDKPEHKTEKPVIPGLEIDPELTLNVVEKKEVKKEPLSGFTFGFERVLKKEEKDAVLSEVESLSDEDSDFDDLDALLDIPGYSGTYPALKDGELWDALDGYNEEPKEETLAKIKERISASNYTPTHKDEMISRIEDLAIQKRLRKELGLLKEGDVVCPFSQGNIQGVSNNAGINACGTICKGVIDHLEAGHKIDSEEVMQNLILQGIKEHGHGEQAKFFDEVMKGSSYKLASYEDIDKGIRGAVEEAEKSKGYLVMTFSTAKQNETILVYYPEKGKPALFDSHGKEYAGVDKGASLRQFVNHEALLKHLEKNYSEKGFNPAFFIVTR